MMGSNRLPTRPASTIEAGRSFFYARSLAQCVLLPNIHGCHIYEAFLRSHLTGLALVEQPVRRDATLYRLLLFCPLLMRMQEVQFLFQMSGPPYILRTYK